MPSVQIADIYNPLTFARREQEAQIELNAFLQSGILMVDPRLSDQASAGGNVGDMPFYKPLGTEEPNYSSDDPGVNSAPNKITSGLMKWRLASQNNSWSTMDLARELALEDPVAAITGRTGKYWATTNERRLIQSVLGILSDNVNNFGGDMVEDIATDDIGLPTAAELISAEALIDAEQTAGDHQGGFTAIAMHSVPYSNLRKQQLIDFVRDADNNTMFATFGGKRVVVDDSLPAVAGVNRVTYTTVLFGAGSWIWGNGRVINASESDRDPSSGNGGGQDILYSRRADIIHPLGFAFTSNTVAGQSPTLAELASSTNWNRVWERKNVPLAFLNTNG